jgi:hypothetical protein
MLLAVVSAGIMTTGCKQKSKEEPEPTVTPSASAAAAATPEAPPPAEAIPPPPTPPSVPAAAGSAKGGSGESLKTCCAALHKEADGATPDKKANLQSVAGTCDAISKLVASGTTKKAAALTSLRASMRGAPLPAGCN